MPHACIGVDVIVGFPGETEEEFLKTYNLLNELDISYLHVFTYSERQNTTAIKMEGVVPIETRRERSKMLHILSNKKRRHFYEQHLNTNREVLFETENHDGFIHGFTDNYVKIQVPYQQHLLNEICRVTLERVDADGLMNATNTTLIEKEIIS